MSDQKRRMQNVRESAQKQAAGSGLNVLKLPEGVKLFKPKAGTMLIDILPYKVGEGNPFADEGNYYHERTYYVHKRFGPAGGSYICLSKTVGKPCPLCEYTEKMERRGDLGKKELDQMRPKRRQLFWVIDRKDREAGVQLWEDSYATFGKLLAERLNSERAEAKGWDKFSDPEEGMSLEITFTEKPIEKNKWLVASAIDFVERKKQYTWEFVDENTHCLDEILKIEKYAKLVAMLESGEDDGSADEDEDKPKKRASDDESDDEDRPKKKKSSDDDDEDETPKKKSKKDEDDGDWDDDDDAPKKKKAAASDDDDEEEAPRKKKSSNDDESDEDEDVPAKKKKPAVDDDEEDEDETPKKKKKSSDDDEDDEDEKPAKKKRALDDDDDDDAPKKKSKSDDDDEDEEEKPAKKKKPAADDDDWDDDEDEKPAKKKKPADDDED